MLRERISLGAFACAGSLLMVGVLAPASSASHGNRVKMKDDCQPATFNALFGAGVCQGDGDTSAQAFLAEVAATKQAREWRFDPRQLKVRGGRPVILENEGGETHTFTLVQKFGGGFIPALNDLSGNTVPAPECVNPGNPAIPAPPNPKNVFVEAGAAAAFQTAGLRPGRYMFQCCIHPWMRVILTVR